MKCSNQFTFNGVFSLSSLVACILVCGLWPTSSSHAEESVEQLIRQLQQPISNNRVDAATRLARLGRQASDATDALINCLGDSENDVRLLAAYALGCVQTDSPKVLAALVPLLDDRDEHVRYSSEWSIARIAKGLGEVQSAEVRRDLTLILKQSITALSRHEHQPRHRVAIELALGKLVHITAVETVPAPVPVPVAVPVAVQEPVPVPEPDPVPVVTVDKVDIETPAPVETTPAIDEYTLAKSAYQANDQFGRFQFVKRISDEEKYPDILREIVLEIESQAVATEQAEAFILRYAVAAWGEIGQRVLAHRIQQIPDDRMVSGAEVQLILQLKPSSPELIDRLLVWASDPNQEVTVRAAAIESLSDVRPISEAHVDAIIKLFYDEAGDHEIRSAAANSLQKMGPTASRAEPILTAVLMHSTDESMGFWALDGLTAVAPMSPTAATVVLELLRRRPYTDPLFPNIVEACGNYGELCADSVPVLTSLLTCEDRDIRGASARALGQIGIAAKSAAAQLALRIVDKDEEISVKNRAAVALQRLGSNVLAELLSRQTSDNSVRENILRALAIAGPQAIAAQEQCLGLVRDDTLSPELRSAAVNALGAMGPAAQLSMAHLMKLCEATDNDQLAAACVLAVARIDPAVAAPIVKKQVLNPSMIVRASAAFGLHLCGDSKASFDELVGMIDGSSTDTIIEQTIGDLGPIVESWLLDVANDVSANRFQRLACCALAGNLPSPEWPRLLPLAEDVELGEEFTFCLQGCWREDSGAVETLLGVLESRQFTPVARARIAGLLTPDGLGAGEEDEDWLGITLSKPMATSELLAAESTNESAMAIEEPAGAESETRSAIASQIPRPIQPALPARAQASSVASSAAASPRMVDVFYGTNRSRDLHESSYHEFAIAVLATSAGCLCVMLFCLMGAVRSGNRAFAVVALIAIGIVGPLGFYAAQKLSIHDIQAPVVYGKNYLDSVELGVCKVSIPPGHQPGMLESPSLFRMEIASDPHQHVVLTKVQQLSKDKFFEDLRSVETEKGKNLLVFIHGYNVSFEDAARRTAQMSVDLNFPGAPVFYSWPSQANWYGYAADAENIQLSVKHIRSFLEDLAKNSGAESINLVAHSMGNVGLTEALKEIQSKEDAPMFNQVVLAAPDIDADVFKNRIAPQIVAKAKHVTLYTSQTDLALVASRYFNNGPRIGDSGEGIPLFQGIDTIDATAVDSSLLGHSYYGSNVTVLTDLGRLLENQPIDRRDYLRKFVEGPAIYWAFDPMRVSQLQTLSPNR